MRVQLYPMMYEDEDYRWANNDPTTTTTGSPGSSSSSSSSSLVENTSYYYCFNDSSSNDNNHSIHELLRLVLRHIKVWIWKVGHIYFVQQNPYLLAILPCLVGFLLGYFIGYQHKSINTSNDSHNHHINNNQKTTTSPPSEKRPSSLRILTTFLINNLIQPISQTASQISTVISILFSLVRHYLRLVSSQLWKCCTLLFLRIYSLFITTTSDTTTSKQTHSQTIASPSSKEMMSKSTNPLLFNTIHHHGGHFTNDLTQRESHVRQKLHENANRLDLDQQQSPSSSSLPNHNDDDYNNFPRHVAIIMDGNRRFGRQHYGSASRGHWEGCQTLLQLCQWCCDIPQLKELTVYAFSTENWNRSSHEVDTLMTYILQYCQELKQQAQRHSISIKIKTTNPSKIPSNVMKALEDVEQATLHFTSSSHCNLILNICFSYGSRDELTLACRSIARECVEGRLDVNDVTPQILQQYLKVSSDPDFLIRTSGEVRLSNFLLWQLAYAELYFWDKTWPEMTRDDFINLLRLYGTQRQRRYGL